MRVGTVYYNFDTDQTTIKWSDDFMTQDTLLRADVLRDLSGMAEKAYDDAVEDWKEEYALRVL